MTKHEALKLALEALEAHADIGIKSDKAITAIKQALAAPVQEPVAIPEYIRDAAKHLHENRFEPSFMVRAIVGWINGSPPAAQPAPVQEPVAWMQPDEVHISLWKDDYHTIPLYTTPPAAQRQWVGLTDEDKLHIEIMGGKSDVMLAEMVEIKLKERNT